jgi:hypothetical protein
MFQHNYGKKTQRVRKTIDKKKQQQQHSRVLSVGGAKSDNC